MACTRSHFCAPTFCAAIDDTAMPIANAGIWTYCQSWNVAPNAAVVSVPKRFTSVIISTPLSEITKSCSPIGTPFTMSVRDRRVGPQQRELVPLRRSGCLMRYRVRDQREQRERWREERRVCRAGDAEPRERPEAEDEQRVQNDVERHRHQQEQERRLRIARAAQHRHDERVHVS